MMIIQFLYGLLVGILFSCLHNYFRKKSKSDTKRFEDSEKRIFKLVESAKDIIYYYQIKPEPKYIYLSPSIEKVLGSGLVERSYQNPYTHFELIHPDDYEILAKKINGNIDYDQPIVQRWRDEQGNYIWFEEYTTPIFKNGELVAVQGIIRNINDKVNLQKDLEYRITHDALTDIHNRQFFEKNMEIYDQHVNIPVAIILCDLDELKYVNDNHGHKKGDALIKEFAKILSRYSSENTIVSRIGGDEFAILVTDTDSEYVESMVDHISKDIIRYNENSTDIKIKMSIGYAFSHHSIGKMEDLFTEADKNMYFEKRLKKNNMLHQLESV
jgi:diguanylate cyclase (GGDEF)-like protein/PAS domain S-box-containing protein